MQDNRGVIMNKIDKESERERTWKEKKNLVLLSFVSQE